LLLVNTGHQGRTKAHQEGDIAVFNRMWQAALAAAAMPSATNVAVAQTQGTFKVGVPHSLFGGRHQQKGRAARQEG
jgi:hypothetical protein